MERKFRNGYKTAVVKEFDYGYACYPERHVRVNVELGDGFGFSGVFGTFGECFEWLCNRWALGKWEEC